MKRGQPCHVGPRLAVRQRKEQLDLPQGGRVVLDAEGVLEPDLMRPALEGRVVFNRGIAHYFEPYQDLPLVRIDPRIAFGRPVVIDGTSATPTAKLAEVAENEGVEAAADWYLVSSEAVRQAADFDHRLAA